MRRRRVLIAAAVGALLALAVAVPVVAGVAGIPAQNGYERLYSFTANDSVDGGDPQVNGPSTVRIAYDLAVHPWVMTYRLVGTRLAPSTDYVLVNVFAYHNDPAGPWAGSYTYHVDLPGAPIAAGGHAGGWIIGEGRTNRLGMLTIKGRLSIEQRPGFGPLLLSFAEVPAIPNSREIAGADVWLIPRAAIDEYNHIGLPHFSDPEPGFVYTIAGLPFYRSEAQWFESTN